MKFLQDEDDDEESETEKTPKKHGSVTMGGAPNIPPAQPDDSTDVEAELQQLEANEKEKSQMATGRRVINEKKIENSKVCDYTIVCHYNI